MEKKVYPPLAIGTWSWGVGGAGGDMVFGHHLSEKELEEVYLRAISHGLNLFDTATVYGMGDSERILAYFLKKYPSSGAIVSTKFTPQIAPNCDNPVLTMCENSLKVLGRDYIDLYWIHNPMDVDRFTPMLIPLVKKGLVKRVGVSNHNMPELHKAEEILGKEGIKISAVQNHYSLLYRSSEKAGILKYCQDNDIDFFAYMVLEQGALSGKYTSSNPLPQDSQRGQTYNPLLGKIDSLTKVMKEIGEAHDISISQVAIAWAIAKGTIPIIGVSKISQVDEARDATSVFLSEVEMERLEIASSIDIDTKGDWEHHMEQ